MSKRLIVSLVIVILIAIFTIGIFVYKNNNKENIEKSDINNEEESNMDNNANSDQNKEEKSNKKILVVYYSAQSHTKAVAEKIAKNLEADIYEIIDRKSVV